MWEESTKGEDVLIVGARQHVTLPQGSTALERPGTHAADCSGGQALVLLVVRSAAVLRTAAVPGLGSWHQSASWAHVA